MPLPILDAKSDEMNGGGRSKTRAESAQYSDRETMILEVVIPESRTRSRCRGDGAGQSSMNFFPVGGEQPVVVGL